MSTMLLFLLCFISQTRASEDFWEETFDEDKNCASRKEMVELDWPRRCVSTNVGMKHEHLFF